jgi:hypothetical protein
MKWQKIFLRIIKETSNVMRKLFIVSILFFSLQACSDGYRESTVNADLIQKLNIEIVKGRLNNEDWVRTPEDIARYLFPHVTQDGDRSQSYTIKKEVQSSSNCIITVTAEGLLDDEISGERHRLYFRNQEDEWSISNLTAEMKWVHR